ncbi:MAG: DUF87 domain-containing protein [Desulfurococcaceae archaeon]
MKLLAKFLTELGFKIIQLKIRNVEVDPPDLIIQYPSGVVLSRILICRDTEYDVEELLSERSKTIFEEYVALLKSLPSSVHLYLYKEEFDLDRYLKNLKNSILNTQADLELVQSETEKLKLRVKLDKLKTLYHAIIEGKPFLKISLAVVFRIDAKDKSTAKSMADYYESIVTSVFKNSFGLRLERAGYSEIASFILSVLGLNAKTELSSIHIEADRLSYFQPVTLDKPMIDEPGILIGFEKNTMHPVVLQLKYLYHHIAVIGPTGRGKSTLLASLVEQVVSEGFSDVVIIDFKGDLRHYISDELIPVLTPDNAPINILNPPPGIEYMSWRGVVVESLSHAGGISPEIVLKALVVVERDPKEASKNPSASVIIPFVEFIEVNTDYEWIKKHLARGNALVLINLEGRGTTFQNTYASLLLGIVRHLLLRESSEKGLLLLVDDAWRILKLKTLLEIVREGRSRKLGVVVSSQGPEDFPNEILENIYNILVFGSKNEEYLDKVRKILGIKPELTSVLSKLSVGEAIYVNAVLKNAKVLNIHTPLKLRTLQKR